MTELNSLTIRSRRKRRRSSYCFTESLPPTGKRGRPKGDWCTHDEAREWVRRQNFKSYKDWLKFAKARWEKGPLKGRIKRPRSIPSNPQSTYKNQWISDSYFLGHQSFISYNEAKKYVHQLKILSYSKWTEWHDKHKPVLIPKLPDHVYDDWIGWGDFLGNGSIAPKKRKLLIRPYNEAIKYVHSLNLYTGDEYRQWHKDTKCTDLPCNADVFYKDQWEGWSTFLGKSIENRLDIAKTDITVLAITQHHGYETNVVRIQLEKMGKWDLIAKSKTNNFTVVRTYKHESKYQQDVTNLIRAFSKQWWEGNNMYVFPNLHEFLFQMDSLLLWANE